MSCKLPPEHPIFHGGRSSKSGKGDIGEVICNLILEDYGIDVHNLNLEGRNYPGIDLIFIDPSGICLEKRGKGAVQCRGGIRNPYKHDRTRPEWDGSKIDSKKISKAEQQASAHGANLFYSIAYLYPLDEEKTVLFFFLTTNDFMRLHCSESYGYRFWTHKILGIVNKVQKNIENINLEGLLFRMHMYFTSDLLHIKEVSENLDIKSTINTCSKILYQRMEVWKSWREYDTLFK